MLSLRMFASAAFLACSLASPALAQPCEDDGERLICPVHPAPAASTPDDDEESRELMRRWRAEQRQLRERRRMERDSARIQARLERERAAAEARALAEQRRAILRLLDQADSANRDHRHYDALELIRAAWRIWPREPNLRANVIRQEVFLALAGARASLRDGQNAHFASLFGTVGFLRARDGRELDSVSDIASIRADIASLEAIAREMRSREGARFLAESEQAELARQEADRLARAQALGPPDVSASTSADGDFTDVEAIPRGPAPGQTEEEARTARLALRETFTRAGLIGGMTWNLGMSIPAAATPERREALHQAVIQQANESGIPIGSIDLERYDFVLGIAAYSDFRDFYRVFRDQDNGAYSREVRRRFELLRGDFRELSCHSNGAMLCLRALEFGQARARDVVLYGPQLTRESMRIWREMLRRGDIASLRVVVNSGDPVPPLSILGLGALDRRRTGTTLDLLFNSDSLARTIRDAMPGAEVITYHCNDGVLECHRMERYRQLDPDCRAQEERRGTAAGTRGQRGVPYREPPRPGC